MTARPIRRAAPKKPRRRITQRPEEALQRACAEFLTLAMPPPPAGAVWWHTPNQRGTRSRVEAQILKALGVKAGIPDLLFLWRGRLHCVELKAPKGGRPSPAQIEMHEQLTLAGAVVLEDCRSVEQLTAWLGGLGVPLKAWPAGMLGRGR